MKEAITAGNTIGAIITTTIIEARTTMRSEKRTFLKRLVRKMRKHKGLKLIVLLLAALLLSIPSQAGAEKTLSLPVFTETDCEWDAEGNLIRETARTLDGRPALNNRGFYRAEYAWDAHSNLISEAYFGLDGEPVDTDAGYARAEYTYFRDRSGKSHLLTEDRYAADGGRADIPGSYSYRRDTWEGQQILSTEYFDAEGKLTRPTGGYAQILYDIAQEAGMVTVTKRYRDA